MSNDTETVVAEPGEPAPTAGQRSAAKTTHISIDIDATAVPTHTTHKQPNNARSQPTVSNGRYIACLLACCVFLIAIITVVILMLQNVNQLTSTRGVCDQAFTDQSIAAALPNIDMNIDVTILTSPISPYLSSTATEKTVRLWLDVASERVWRTAKITLHVRNITTAVINETAARHFETKRTAAKSMDPIDFDISKIGSLEELRPMLVFEEMGMHHGSNGNGSNNNSNNNSNSTGSSRYNNKRGIHMYVVKNIPICGSALTGSARGRGSFFVREAPCADHEELSKPNDVIGVVMAHEIGHVLGLPHYKKEDKRCKVMDSKNFGFVLTNNEIQRARAVATTGLGYCKCDNTSIADL